MVLCNTCNQYPPYKYYSFEVARAFVVSSGASHIDSLDALCDCDWLGATPLDTARQSQTETLFVDYLKWIECSLGTVQPRLRYSIDVPWWGWFSANLIVLHLLNEWAGEYRVQCVQVQSKAWPLFAMVVVDIQRGRVRTKLKLNYNWVRCTETLTCTTLYWETQNGMEWQWKE